MEGVVDHHLRRVLTEVGGYTHCVTEFVRVTNQLLPARTYYRLCPELKSSGATPSGIPVIVQLLGSEPACLAENAAKAASLGALGIDLNFGCPAKRVTAKQGGSALLKEPEQIYKIISEVRRSVPAEVPVSAKVRLGYETTDLALDIALCVESAGADSVVVHARTKVDGYRSPARWEWFARVNEVLNIPMIANGDINSVADYLQCRALSGCDDVMLGRGGVARPDLARQILQQQESGEYFSMSWQEVVPLIVSVVAAMSEEGVKPQQTLGRIKQWLVYLKKEYAEAGDCFGEIRQLREVTEIERVLDN